MMKPTLINIALTFTFVFLSKASVSQLIASGDTTICPGGSAQLSASGGGVSYYWQSFPTDPSLLIPQQQNPVVSPQVSTMYVVQSNIATGNLILNGSFELGVMGFNSDYVNNQVSIVNEGTYAVVNDAHTVHPNFFCNEDHTSGSGKFMAVNGAGVANVKVWYLTLTNVQPNRRYEFSTWITSLHETNPAKLQFSINGELMGQPFQAYPYTCDWYQFFYLWDSEENTQATISIVNQNTILSGNDFALDDISFATVLVYYDTVWVDVVPLDVSITADETMVPYGSSTTLHGTWSGGTAPYEYQWTPPEMLVDPNSPDPQTISLENSTQFILSVIDQDGECSGADTILIQVAGDPLEIDLQASVTEMCIGGQSVLTVQCIGGTGNYTYSWTSDPPGFSSNLPEITVMPTVTTQYTVTVSDGLSEEEESVTITVNPRPLANAGPDQVIPYGTNTTLQGSASGGSGNYSYRWEPAAFTLNPDQAVTETINLEFSTAFLLTVTDLQTGCVSTINEMIVQIEGGPLAVNIIASEYDICYGESATMTAYPSGGNAGNYTYYWWDDNGIIYPPTQQITVSPTETTVYRVRVFDGFNETQDYCTMVVFSGAEFIWLGGQDVIFACPYDSITIIPDPRPEDWNYIWSNGSDEDHITVGSTGIGYNVNKYSLNTTSQNGCIYSKEITVVFDFSYCFGIEETVPEPQLAIFPNPTGRKFHIKAQNISGTASLEIISPVQGIIYRMQLNSFTGEAEIDPGEIANGFYIVSLQTDKGKASGKLMISR